MKTFWIFRTLIVVSTLAFLPIANAQTAHHTMTANVPFGFELGSTHMGPGTYRISTPVQNVVELRNGSQVAMILAYSGESSRPSKTAKIVFDRYGDHYFLRQIWFNPEEKSYLESVESKTEKQAKRQELASNPSTKNPSNVEVAILRIP